MKVIPEKSFARFTARFYDDGVPLMPDTVHWRLDCATTGQVLQDWTPVTPEQELSELGVVVAIKAVIQIPAPLNAIQVDRNARERKRLLVTANKDTDTEFSARELEYEVFNQQGRT